MTDYRKEVESRENKKSQIIRQRTDPCPPMLCGGTLVAVALKDL